MVGRLHNIFSFGQSWDEVSSYPCIAIKSSRSFEASVFCTGFPSQQARFRHDIYHRFICLIVATIGRRDRQEIFQAFHDQMSTLQHQAGAKMPEGST